MSNKKKGAQLGIAWGTASHRLRKSIMFKYVVLAGEDDCFQCGGKIESVNELSIEHKEPWLDTEDPVGLFYDLNNIAFSHLECNVPHRYPGTPGQEPPNKIQYPDGKKWCYSCKTFLLDSDFSRNKTKRGGLEDICKECRTIRRQLKKQGEVG